MVLENIQNVLFDLDGTLVDSSETIRSSLEHALERMGGRLSAGSPVEQLIGRPLLDIFQGDFAMTAEQAQEAIDHYREYYDTLNQAGTRIYSQIPELLSRLQTAGYRLFVATVKPTPIAEKVLSDVRLSTYFEGVAGASLGPERRDKTRIIAHALEKFELDVKQTLMIGDRRQDIAGARENGLPAIGVAYGFGSREELVSAKPVRIIERSGEIAAMLL